VIADFTDPVSDTAAQRIFDAVPLLLVGGDRDGRYTHANRAYAQRFGKEPRDLVGQPIVGVVGEPAFSQQQLLVARALKGDRVEVEVTIDYPALGARLLRSVITPVYDVVGAIVGWDAVAEDVTDRRESQERLMAALDASGTGTFRWNMRTNELDWDDNLDRLFGLAPGSAVRSLPEFIRLVHPDDRARVVAACERCRDEAADFEEEFRVVWPCGTVRWLYDKGRTYLDRDRRPHYMTGACVDITERRQKEDALREAHRQKDEFLGILGHELRNPLAPMTFAIASIERSGDPALAKPVAVLGRQLRRMTRLVDDLMDVSRIAQGKIELCRETVDLAAVLRSAIEGATPTAGQRRHLLHVVLADNVFVMGDAHRLGQAFDNLIGNAIKYTPDQGRIEIGLTRSDGEAIVTVSDTGIGIAPDVLPRIFEMFVQSDRSLERAQGGLGIGLTLVDRLIRLHGGSVSATSGGVNCGAEFSVRLPLAGQA
jgi:two-component system CheB/CheR fusion protein